MHAGTTSPQRQNSLDVASRWPVASGKGSAAATLKRTNIFWQEKAGRSESQQPYQWMFVAALLRQLIHWRAYYEQWSLLRKDPNGWRRG